jgi:hypothetical protein
MFVICFLIYVQGQFKFDAESSLFLDVDINCEPVLKILCCRDGTSAYLKKTS